MPFITCLLHPSSIVAHLWTAWMLFLTCSFIAFIEPVFLAFNDTIANNRSTALIDFFAGACFAADVLFNFRTGVYFINEGRIKLVLSPKIVAREYLRGMFWLDFVAAVPWFAQARGFFSTCMARCLACCSKHPGGASTQALGLLHVMRVSECHQSASAASLRENGALRFSSWAQVIYIISRMSIGQRPAMPVRRMGARSR